MDQNQLNQNKRAIHTLLGIKIVLIFQQLENQIFRKLSTAAISF